MYETALYDLIGSILIYLFNLIVKCLIVSVKNLSGRLWKKKRTVEKDWSWITYKKIFDITILNISTVVNKY